MYLIYVFFWSTWVSSKTKMQGVIERAKTQADIYAWIGEYKEAKIIVKNLGKPELDEDVFYHPDPTTVENKLITFIEEKKDQIKKY